MLIDVIPAGARKRVYSIYAYLLFGLGATQVGFTSAGAEQPSWLTVSFAVLAFVGTAIGATAAANTVPKTGDHVAE